LNLNYFLRICGETQFLSDGVLIRPAHHGRLNLNGVATHHGLTEVPGLETPSSLEASAQKCSSS
jgi:hypothetical protein